MTGQGRTAAEPLPGHVHVGRCTTGPTWTRAEAVLAVEAMGFRFFKERSDFGHPDGRRGRLAWTPDFCRPRDGHIGTRFYLVKPFGEGEIPVLPPSDA